jgi:indole-3-glycerol phosphate synthase
MPPLICGRPADAGTLMRTDLSPTLERILRDTRHEIEIDRARESLKRVKQKIADAPPLNSFHRALAGGNALIAEIKECSPSQGAMRRQNFADAIPAYQKSPVVKAISVLTSWHHFGPHMKVTMMQAVKERAGKPVLRKDFIIDDYQVYQARAYGADAILLMANVVTPEEMRRLSSLAFELRMDVLFETHKASEIEMLPEDARIVGINCRNFEGGFLKSFGLARLVRRFSKTDRSVDLARFDYVDKVPAHLLRIAESGVSPGNCAQVMASGFQAALVGTSLLTDERGVVEALRDFERAMRLPRG